LHIRKLQTISAIHKYRGRSVDLISQSYARKSTLAFKKAGKWLHPEKEIQIKKENAKLLEHILKISDRKNKVAV
jgi:hypothetical protein